MSVSQPSSNHRVWEPFQFPTKFRSPPKELAGGVTNYKTLLDQLEHYRRPDETVCLVTFNYDTLLEDALPTVGLKVLEIADYISSDRYKLIKLHG